jgi:putative ABC transport system permease protein
MENLLQDLRYALRTLRRSPGFAIVAVLTLALGIGANTAIFSVVNAVLLRSLPHPAADRLMMVFSQYPEGELFPASRADFLDWREQGTSFEQMAALNIFSSNLTGAGEPERVERAEVTANFLPMLATGPRFGRFFVEGEDREGGANLAVLSEAFWQRRYGGDPRVIGGTVTLHGTPYEIIGVGPPDFQFLQNVDVWTPVDLDGPPDRRGEFLTVVGRIRPDVTREQARAEMQAIGRRLAAEYPTTNSMIRVHAVGVQEHLVGSVRPALLALLGAVGLVLLIACANVANLMLTRAAAREREMAVRAALGAGRGRLARQLVTESIVLALLGGALGLGLALTGIRALRHARAELIPRFAEVGLDPVVLGFTAALAVLTGVLFGLAPMAQLGRDALTGSLRSGGRGVAGAGATHRLRSGLVLGEVALALVLLIGAGLLIRSFDRLQRVEAGFNPGGLLTAQLTLPAAQYETPEGRVAFFEELLGRVRATPGVQGVGSISTAPLSGGASYWSFSIEGHPEPEPGVVVDAQVFIATPEYFRTLGIALQEGRLFGEQDHLDAPRAVVINRQLARRYWDERSPLGSRLTFGDPDDPEVIWRTVVGVVDNVRVTGLTDAPYPQIYFPHAQLANANQVIIARTTGNPERLVPLLRETVRALDPALPLYNVGTMEQRFGEMTAQPRVSTWLLTVFAAAALLLAAVGIYGLISYTVAQRTPEIGIRMALGAQPADVLRLMIGEGMKPAFGGIVVGVFGAWAASRIIRGLLYDVSATDPATFGAVVLFLIAVAVLAAYLPARRATRVDPIVALRAD